MLSPLTKHKGFTLIEVLIALTILSIALTAMIKSTSQNIKDTYYLQHKTIATWVATEMIHETQAGILKLPMTPDTLDQEKNVLGENWLIKGSVRGTPNPKIQEIEVAVFQNSDEGPLIQLKSYLYVQAS